MDVYERDQLILVRGYEVPSSESRKAQQKVPPIRFATLQQLYAKHPKVVKRAFFVEKPPDSLSSSSSCTASHVADVLLGDSKCPRGPWYASFVVQRNRSVLGTFLKSLPFRVPPFLEDASAAQHGAEAPKHSDAAWVFFGRNEQQQLMRGRAEHTDAIEHSGTWHIQLHGSKVWTLRPTDELIRRNRKWKDVGHFKVHCQAGDVLCVNTRLWWHRTHIPGNCPFSLSVARDMYLDGTQPDTPNFTNVKGHYATRVFDRGSVVFTQDEAPDLALPRSRTSNCALRDAGGELVVVAKRRIKPGEWFSISESEDEDAEPAPKKRRR